DPRPVRALAAGQHLVRGMAWSPHGVAHVEVSADGGAHWQLATLLDDLGLRSWGSSSGAERQPQVSTCWRCVRPIWLATSSRRMCLSTRRAI
ncbi:MAG: hypothetical protein M3R61_07660, partial [Chloroflexota bacterium]|nr:hypothetical protein [Chloroflexota bacterium]